MSTTSSNGVTGSLASPRQGFGEGALKSTGSPTSCRWPPRGRVPITTLRVADRPRLHHPGSDFWRVSVDAVASHPVGGLGQDNFADYYVSRGRSGEEPS